MRLNLGDVQGVDGDIAHRGAAGGVIRRQVDDVDADVQGGQVRRLRQGIAAGGPSVGQQNDAPGAGGVSQTSAEAEGSRQSLPA